MTPVDQVYLREHGAAGDCWRACVASILDVRLADVPHLMLDVLRELGAASIYGPADHRPDGGALAGDWVQTLERCTNAFLAPYRKALRSVTVDYENGKLVDADDIARLTPFVIASGESPRGCGHSVVGDLLRLVDDRPDWIAHDPHRSRAGILNIWDVYAIVPMAER